MIHPKNWAGIIKLFPSRETLISDIPAGDGKMANLFYSVFCTAMCEFFIEPPPDTQRTERQGERGIWVVVCCYLL
jgi:hypothetical protein